MADTYDKARTFLDLIDQANGLPKNTTPTGTLSLEQYTELAGKMARAINILRWGLVGCMGGIVTEHQIPRRSIRKHLPFYDFEWEFYIRMQYMMGDMIDAGAIPDLLVQPEVAHAIFYQDRRYWGIDSAEKKLLWDIARATGWHTPRVQAMIREFVKLKRSLPERAKEISKACLDAAERMARLATHKGFPAGTPSMAGNHVLAKGYSSKREESDE